MGTKQTPGAFDCYNRALSDEPMFTLLARDISAPTMVRLWADTRIREIEAGLQPESDKQLIQEALNCADQMTEWRLANPGRWHTEKPEPPASLAQNYRLRAVELLGEALYELGMLLIRGPLEQEGGHPGLIAEKLALAARYVKGAPAPEPAAEPHQIGGVTPGNVYWAPSQPTPHAVQEAPNPEAER